MKNLCIIPARGGSKRIPHKNVRLFMGRPIVAYSIESALKCGLFDEVMVSTDDPEIAEVAKQYGAKVPFFRSAETANDFATTADVLREVLNKYKELGKEFDNMCCLYATAPLVKSEDIARGFNMLKDSKFTVMCPVVPFSYTIWRCFDVADDGSMKRHWPEYEKSRSQDLPTEYHDSGTFYWYKVKDWFAGNRVLGAIIVDETTVQDIDTETDWKIAEMKYQILNAK